MSHVTIGNKETEIDVWSSNMKTAKIFTRREKKVINAGSKRKCS
jgi:hypothetical protein